MQKTFAGMTLLLIITVTLTACGFKLRGHNYLPSEMRTIYLTSHAPYGPLTEQLRQTLTGMDIQLVQQAKDAPITLNIISDGTSRQLSGFSTTSQINTYQLNYTVHYEILDKTGRRLGPARSTSTSRSYVSNSNEVSSTNLEYTRLEQDMQREAVYQIISSLGSKGILRHLK